MGTLGDLYKYATYDALAQRDGLQRLTLHLSFDGDFKGTGLPAK